MPLLAAGTLHGGAAMGGALGRTAGHVTITSGADRSRDRRREGRGSAAAAGGRGSGLERGITRYDYLLYSRLPSFARQGLIMALLAAISSHRYLIFRDVGIGT